MPPSPWPRRTRVCVQCRTALSAGETCTWIRHDVVDLSEPAGRAFFLEEVWGSPLEPPPPPSLRDRALDALAELLSPGSTAPLEGAPPSWGVRQPDPRGAREEPLRATRTMRLSGRIAADAPTAPSPLSGAPCAIHGLRLLHAEADGSPLMLRDAATLEVAIDLADGCRVLLPRGTVDLDAPGRRRTRSAAAVESYLAVLDPFAPEHTVRPTFPHDEVREALLGPGDEVLLSGDLEPVPDPRAMRGGAYREAAATVLRPRGGVLVELPRGARKP